jgi:dimethylargininase
MIMALTRDISPAIVRCELTHLDRVPIDVDRAQQQHADYEWALVEAGCTVRRLHATDDMPDSVFIEDIAVVFDELTVITRPGAASRRLEAPGVVDALERLQGMRYRPQFAIDAPGTLDGGDVIVAGRRVFVGSSARTNREGIEQLREIVQQADYSVTAVPVRECLHLKSAATAVGPGTVLINRAWVDAGLFRGLELIDVHPDEPSAGNAASVGNRLLFPTAFPRTRERLEQRGLRVRTVDVSELAKAEGAVTCCSLLVDV